MSALEEDARGVSALEASVRDEREAGDTKAHHTLAFKTVFNSLGMDTVMYNAAVTSRSCSF